MRDSVHTIPQVNRAVCTVSQNMYDRRALDCNSPIPLLTTLTNLTYLTSTSPRIREVLTADGGLERILDILRGASRPVVTNPPADLWGLSGPSTARVISMDRQIGLRHSLAFQCIVNIGVRGSEGVRTRVVQSGSLDLIAHILEEWLRTHDMVIEPCNVGSKEAVEAARGRAHSQDLRRKLRLGTRHTSSEVVPDRMPPGAPPVLFPPSTSVQRPEPAAPVDFTRPPGDLPSPTQADPPQADIDVEMDDNEPDAMSEFASNVGDTGMDMDVEGTVPARPVTPERLAAAAAALATPRAANGGLPTHAMSSTAAIDIPPRPISRDEVSAASSGANSYSNGGDSQAMSEQSVPEIERQPHRPPPLNLAVARIPGLAQGGPSNQSSPMGTPTRMEMGETLRPAARRDTIVGRPALLVPPPARPAADGPDNESVASEEPGMNVAPLAPDLEVVTRQFEAFAGPEPVDPPAVEIVERVDGLGDEEPDAETMAAEQARLDLEAGAPPGQPGAMVTPPAPATATDAPQPVAPVPPTVAPAGEVTAPQAQVIIAAGAPRGFHDLASYVGLITMTNPTGDRFSDDCVLLSLQLLAYLSKYPHVRTAFHHPRRPMHPTFDLGLDESNHPLPFIPPMSQSRNVFSLVERFTFKPSVTDPTLFKIPEDIHYWAGVIMRNACRKDDVNGGIRQCAHMSCGKWEASAREFAKCRRCRKAKYCSKECQSKAWAEGHRFWCNARNEDAPEPARQAGTGPPRPADYTSTDEVVAVMPNTNIPRDILHGSIIMARAFHPGIHVIQRLARENPNVRPELAPEELAAWTLRVLGEQMAGRDETRLANMFAAFRNEPRHLAQLFISAALNDQVAREFMTPEQAQQTWAETIPALPATAPPRFETIQGILRRTWRFAGGEGPTNVQPTTRANLEAHNANQLRVRAPLPLPGPARPPRLDDILNRDQVPPPTRPVHAPPPWLTGVPPGPPRTAPPPDAARQHPADVPQGVSRPATTGPPDAAVDETAAGGGVDGQNGQGTGASRLSRIAAGFFGRNRTTGQPDQPR